MESGGVKLEHMTTGRLLTTPRLTLEPLSRDHAVGLFEIFRDANNIQYWQPAPHHSIDESMAWVDHKLSFVGDTWWTICTRDPYEVIGCVDFIGAMVMGMGYLIRADRRRQGYAAEAVSAALDEGFQHHGCNRFELWINASNIPSQRLAAKVGFRQRGQFYQRNDGNPYETLVMGLRADEWAAQKGASEPARREVAFYGVTPVLHVPALWQTVEFYVDKLGFSLDYIEGHPPNFAIISRGEWTTERAQIHLVQQPDPDLIPPPGSLYVRIGAAVEILCDEFRAKGVAIVSEPVLQPYGIKEFSIRDNNGWLLRFAGVD
jgi:RimJ/RimL family protein N-acetyltransferase